MDRREELEIEYQKYIEQLAIYHLENKTAEIEVVLKIIDGIQNAIRDIDIANAIKEKSKENSNIKNR